MRNSYKKDLRNFMTTSKSSKINGKQHAKTSWQHPLDENPYADTHKNVKQITFVLFQKLAISDANFGEKLKENFKTREKK